jgi:Lactate racemase N-terminal domain
MESLFRAIETLRFPRELPATLLEVNQRFDVVRVDDVRLATRQALENSGMLARIKPGDSVAVGVGSRGITNMAVIARAAVERLLEHGAQPFVVAAMGSHGGATAEGQREMLASLGVTPEFVGCEFRITMDVREIGRIPHGPALYMDEHSAAADHSLLLSRIKPHTDFRGAIESGPAKMAVIGFGKQKGAQTMHAYGGNGFRQYLAPAARVYEANTNFLGAVGIIENAYDETGMIVGLSAAQVGTQIEADLQTRAKAMMARIPFEQLDILVVQRQGKNISGAGMDPNITHRLMVPREVEPTDGPSVIVTLDLTDETHGNAAGLGFGNVVTKRLLDKVDFYATYMNGITSGTFGIWRTNIPMVMKDDLRALEVASHCCGVPQPADVRYCFIRDTLALDKLYVSRSLLREVEANPCLEVVGEVALTFADGVMRSPWQLS